MTAVMTCLRTCWRDADCIVSLRQLDDYIALAKRAAVLENQGIAIILSETSTLDDLLTDVLT